MWVFIAFVVGFAALFAYGWWSYHYGDGKRQREREAEEALQRQRRVEFEGWDYESRATGDIKYLITGRLDDGADWVLRYDSDHSSSSSSPKLIFEMEALPSPDEEWHITDTKTYDVMQKRAVKMVISGLSALIGSVHARTARKRMFFEAARAQQAGSVSFQARYVLVAIEPRWRLIVDDQTERLMLRWPAFKTTMTWRDNALSAEKGERGLHVQLFVESPSFEVIQQVITLGRHLADRHRTVRAERSHTHA